MENKKLAPFVMDFIFERAVSYDFSDYEIPNNYDHTGIDRTNIDIRVDVFSDEEVVLVGKIPEWEDRWELIIVRKDELYDKNKKVKEKHIDEFKRYIAWKNIDTNPEKYTTFYVREYFQDIPEPVDEDRADEYRDGEYRAAKGDWPKRKDGEKGSYIWKIGTVSIRNDIYEKVGNEEFDEELIANIKKLRKEYLLDKDWELYDDAKANLCNMLNPLKEYDQEEIEQEVPKPKGMRM